MYSLKQLAEYIHADIEGDEAYGIEGLAKLEKAHSQQLTFYTNSRYKQYLSSTQAGCVLLHPNNRTDYEGNKLISNDPYFSYACLTALFESDETKIESGIHGSANIGADVKLGKNVAIGANVVVDDGCIIGDDVCISPGCYIGKNTTIGSHTVLYSNVNVYYGVNIGHSCIFHSASVIGADGFGFAPSANGWQKIHQLGSVEIGDNVEIGAGTTIDRGAIDNTIIASGVKIDNQVQIAHNVEIGENTAIASSAAIAGSTVIGKRCTIAGAVGIVGHLQIADDVHITAMTMVTKSILHSGSYSSGVPMNETRIWRKNAARFNQLDAMARQLKHIKK